MKKLIELRQKKTELATHMCSLLTKAEEEKRYLNDDESKQFDELRTQTDPLQLDITRYEALTEEERGQDGKAKPANGDKKVTNEEQRQYIP